MGMSGKRKRNDDSDAEDSKKSHAEKKEQFRPAMIKNKEKRSEVHAKLKQQKKLEKRAKAKARDAAVKRAIELGEEVLLILLISQQIESLLLLLLLLLLFFLFFFSVNVHFCVFVAASRKEGASYD